ncbi:MAG TPA: VTT domain-containing protein [Gemmatimonadales bacterium]|nr:VTT domain-containing protein [Gemmatimonadales bacterium]
MSGTAQDPREPTVSAWRRPRLVHLVIALIAAVAAVVAVVVLGRDLEHHLAAIEHWVESQGPWAPVVFAGAYAILSSVFVPDLLLGLVAGASFGFGRGAAAVIVGSVGAASMQYLLAHHLLGPRISRFVARRPALAAIVAAVRQDELRLQFLLRLTPLNRATTSYLLGAGGVRFRHFLLALAGIVPSLCLEVYAGYAGTHLARVAGSPGRGLVGHDIVIAVGLVVAILVSAQVSRIARRAIDQAVVNG